MLTATDKWDHTCVCSIFQYPIKVREGRKQANTNTQKEGEWAGFGVGSYFALEYKIREFHACNGDYNSQLTMKI